MTRLARHESLLSRIITVVGHLADSFPQVEPGSAPPNDFSLALRRISTESHVVSIWGDRGTGKSTLLAQVLERLSDDRRFVVFPPLSPELFGDHDSLLNVALASIQSGLPAIAASATEATQLEFLKALQRSRRSAAVNAVPLDRLVTAATSIGEFAREIQDVAGGTEQMWQDAQRLFRSVTGFETGRKSIVVAVDDADLMRPSAVIDLVRQVRLLGSCDHVIAIVGGRENEIANRFVREAREDAYLGHDRHEFNLELEKDIRRAALAQMRKAFPQWGVFRMPEPGWDERVQFTPAGETASLLDLLVKADEILADLCGSRTLVEHLLNDSRGQNTWLTETMKFPLPPNLRALAQLWTSLKLCLDQSEMSDATRLAQILDCLAAMIDVPFGVRDRLEWDFNEEVGSTSDTQALAAYFKFSGIYGVVEADAWRDLDTVRIRSAQDEIERHVEFDLRKFRWQFARWSITSTSVRHYDDWTGCQGLLLAIQGMLIDNPRVKLSSANSYTHGVTIDSLIFLQSVHIYGRSTDDQFLLFPLTPTLTSTARTVMAWNAIVERAEREHLSFREILALTVHSVVEIYYEERDVDVANAPTDYATALGDLNSAAEYCLAQLRGRTGEPGLRQHMVAWYQRLVPNHWHEALFTQQEIQGFCNALVRVSGGTNPVTHPQRVYGEASLGRRLARFASDAGKTETVEKYAWTGGYQTTVENLEITLAPTWGLIRQAWQRLPAAFAAGSAGIALVAETQDPAVTPHVLRTGPTAVGSSGDGDMLLAYARARLRNWATGL